MDPAVIGAGAGILRFQRAEQAQLPVADRADVEPVLRREELPLGVDGGDVARHERQGVQLRRAGAVAQGQFEQAVL